MRFSSRTVVAAACVGACIGCGRGGGPTPADAGDAAETCTSTGAAVDLNGTWAARASLSVTLHEGSGATIHLCPNPQTAVSTLILRFDITQTATSLAQRIRLCRIVLPGTRGGVTCSADPTANPTIHINPSPGLDTYLQNALVVDAGATLSATTDCAALHPSTFAFVVGATLADPMNDPLPTWQPTVLGCGAGAPGCGSEIWMPCVSPLSVVDDPGPDGDTHQGVTLIVSTADMSLVSGSAFVALRAVPTLSGTVVDSTLIRGNADATIEYGLLGSSVVLTGGLCINSATIQSTLPTFDVDPTQSTFALKRVDGLWGTANRDTDGNLDVSCDEIINQQDQIFY